MHRPATDKEQGLEHKPYRSAISYSTGKTDGPIVIEMGIRESNNVSFNAGSIGAFLVLVALAVMLAAVILGTISILV